MPYSNSYLNKALMLGCCFVALAQCGCNKGMSASETAARDALREMGAIIVNDADGVHPATIMMMSEQIEQDLNGAIEKVGDLSYLTHLDVTDLAITDDHMKTVAGLSKINSLVLSGTSITDVGLKNIAGLSKMDTLYLDKTAISPAAVDVVSGFSKLKILEMSECDVISNLAPLAKLENLEWLILKNSELDSSAVDVLSGLPSMSRLSINGSKIAAEDLARLKKAKPSLAIDQDAAPEEPEAAASETTGA